MEAKPSKSTQKKHSSDAEKASSNKKNQSHKKKKKNRKRSDVKETGKSSTSPDELLHSDNAPEVDSDVDKRSSSKPKAVQHVTHTTTKYSEAIATLKQNRRKPHSDSPKPNNRDQKPVKPGASSSRFTSPMSPSPKGLGASSKCVKKESSSLTIKHSSYSDSSKHVPYSNSVKTLPYSTSTKSASYSSTNRQSMCGSLVQDLQKMSLRWEYETLDAKSEEDRLRVYKLNRRMRYLASSSQSYSDWLATGVTGDGDAEIQESIIHNKSEVQHTSHKLPVARARGQQKVVPDLSMVNRPKLHYNSHNQDIMLQC